MSQIISVQSALILCCQRRDNVIIPLIIDLPYVICHLVCTYLSLKSKCLNCLPWERQLCQVPVKSMLSRPRGCLSGLKPIWYGWTWAGRWSKSSNMFQSCCTSAICRLRAQSLMGVAELCQQKPELLNPIMINVFDALKSSRLRTLCYRRMDFVIFGVLLR